MEASGSDPPPCDATGGEGAAESGEGAADSGQGAAERVDGQERAPPRPPEDANIADWVLFNAPQELTCPLTRQVLRDAVRFRGTRGPIMSRAAIQQWVIDNGTSPWTRQAVTLADLEPCPDINAEATRWLDHAVQHWLDRQAGSSPPRAGARTAAEQVQVTPEQQKHLDKRRRPSESRAAGAGAARSLATDMVSLSLCPSLCLARGRICKFSCLLCLAFPVFLPCLLMTYILMLTGYLNRCPRDCIQCRHFVFSPWLESCTGRGTIRGACLSSPRSPTGFFAIAITWPWRGGT